jgi:hypothetical protein
MSAELERLLQEARAELDDVRARHASAAAAMCHGQGPRYLLSQHKPFHGNPALTDPPGIPGQQRELEAAHGRAYRAPQVSGI